MKDFREQVVQRPVGYSEVAALLHKGQLAKALRKARAAGIILTQTEIDTAANLMFKSGGVGALLAMIGTVEVKLPYSITELFVRTFEVGDYHGLLKQAHRLGVTTALDSMIQEAIEAIERHNPNEAAAWRRKLHVK